MSSYVAKNPPANAGDARNTRDIGLTPGLGRSPGEGHGNPLQYSCLENPMDRGAWQATVHRVADSDTSEATQQSLYIKPGQMVSTRLTPENLVYRILRSVP